MDYKTLSYILEINYLKQFNREVTHDLTKNRDLYPRNWYSIQDYEFRCKILAEAINKRVKIIDTDLYRSIDGCIKKR